MKSPRPPQPYVSELFNFTSFAIHIKLIITAKISAKNIYLLLISPAKIILIQHFSDSLKGQQSNFDICLENGLGDFPKV